MDSASSESTSLSSLVHQFFILGNNQARLSLEQQVHILKTHPDGLTLALNSILCHPPQNTGPHQQIHAAKFATLPADFPLPTPHFSLQQCPLSVDPELQQQPYLVFVILGVLQHAVWKYLYSPPQLQQYFFLGIFTLMFASPSLSFPAFVTQKTTSLLADLLLCEWSQRRCSPLAWLTQFPYSPAYVNDILALALCMAQKCNALDATYLLSHETRCLEQQWRETAHHLETWVCECFLKLRSSNTSSSSSSSSKITSQYPSPVSPTQLEGSPEKSLEVCLSILQFLPSAPAASTVLRVSDLCRSLPDPGSLSPVRMSAFETFHAWLSKPSLSMNDFQVLFEHCLAMLSQPHMFFAAALANPNSSEDSDTALQAWLHLLHPLIQQHLPRLDPATVLPAFVETIVHTLHASDDTLTEVIDTLADFLASAHPAEHATTAHLYLPAAHTLFHALLRIVQTSSMTQQPPAEKKHRYLPILEKLAEAFPQAFYPPLHESLAQCFANLRQNTALDTLMPSFQTCFQLLSPTLTGIEDTSVKQSLLHMCAEFPELLVAHFQHTCVRDTACAFLVFLSRFLPSAPLPPSVPSLLHQAFQWPQDDVAVCAARFFVQCLRAPSPSLSPSLFPTAAHTPTSPLFPYYVQVVYLVNPGQAAALLAACTDRTRYTQALTLLVDVTPPKQLDTFLHSADVLAPLQAWVQSTNTDPAPLLDLFALLLHHQVRFPFLLDAAASLPDFYAFTKLTHALLETRSVPSAQIMPFTEMLVRRIRENASFMTPESAQLVNLLLIHYWPFFFHTVDQQEQLKPNTPFLSVMECMFQCIQAGDMELVRTALRGLKDLHLKWRIFHKDIWKHQLYTPCLPVLFRPLVHPDLHLLVDDLAEVLKLLLAAVSTDQLAEWNRVLQRLITSERSVERMQPWIEKIISDGMISLQDLAGFEMNLKALARNIKCISATL